MSHFKNKKSKGFSLIQIVVSLGLMSIIALVMAEIFRQQQKSLQYLTQKYDILNLQNSLNSLFIASSSVCSSQLNGQTFSTTGMTGAAPSPTVISFPSNEIRAGVGSSSYLLAKAGAPLPGSFVAVETIQVNNILDTGVTGRYVANLVIHFDRNSLVQPMKPLNLNLLLYATVSGTTATVVNCGSESKLNCPVTTAWTGSQHQNVFCPIGTTAAWGGCTIVGSGGSGSEDIIASYPITNGWYCGSSHPSRDIRAYVACCN